MLLFVLAFAAPASALDCDESEPTLTTIATGVSVASASVGGDDPGVYYLDNTLCQPECLFDVWVYEETNGLPGLQRSEEIWEDCWWIVSDTLIF